MSMIRPDWTSCLPEHLLASIAQLLPTRIDILRFRAVCRSFRSAVPPSPKRLFPDSILTSTDFLKGPNPRNDELLVLNESTVYAIQPLDKTSNAHHETTQTWIIQVGETKPGTVQILDPLCGVHPRELPKPFNLLDYCVTELSKSYVLQSTTNELNFTKVLLSSFPDETDDEFTVMVIHDSLTKLCIWRTADNKWSDVDFDIKDEYFEDIIYHNQKFYALVSTGCTITVDPKSLTVTQVATGLQLNNLGNWFLYLVGSLKDLFLIVQYDEYNNEDEYYIKAFKLNEEKCLWDRLVDGSELEDRVLFVGEMTSSYSVSAKEFPGCKRSCVYFTADIRDDEYTCPGVTSWIYDVKDNTVGFLSDCPGYSELFWPPPVWLD